MRINFSVLIGQSGLHRLWNHPVPLPDPIQHANNMKKLNNFKSSTYTSTSTTFRSLQWVALVRSARKRQSPQWIQRQYKVDQSNSAWKVGMVLLKECALWMFIVYRCVLSIKVLVDILGTSRFIYKGSMHMSYVCISKMSQTQCHNIMSKIYKEKSWCIKSICPVSIICVYVVCACKGLSCAMWDNSWLVKAEQPLSLLLN